MNIYSEVSQMEQEVEPCRQSLLQQVLHQNVIKVTRDIVRHMNETQRFQKAKQHIIDALKYKHPRFESQSLETPQLFKILYKIQSSSLWEWLLFFCGYAYLFLAIMDEQSYGKKIGLQVLILSLFCIDVGILTYCKKFDNFKKKTKYSGFYYFKVAIIIIMSIDLIIFILFANQDSRPIRPFRILRCFVPILFDHQMRKSLLSLASTYKDILVYLVLFTFIIVGYALIGSKSVTFNPNFQDPDYPITFDQYKMSYNQLKYMIFVVYVTATYDSYPDNQLLAIQNYQPNYLYFISFIFLNMFIFSSIPGSLIYLKYRQTRSKILLIDQIRQQHSLILAFVTLAENDVNLSIDKLIKFLLYLYKYKIRYITHIADICLKLDDHNNNFIQVNQFMQLSKIYLENSAMLPPDFDDIEAWINLRRYVNQKFGLKEKVKHWGFQIFVSICIILSSINAVFVLFAESKFVDFVDDLFIWIFFIQIGIRIVAIGPQNFFADKWNVADAFLVFFGIFFFITDNSNGEGLIRIFRFIRIASLFRIIAKNCFPEGAAKMQIFVKLKDIFTIILEILPIILRFMPLFIFFFYIYTIIGMQLFYNIYDTPGNPNYSQYQQFSNFETIIHAQYVMVQILTQAGWSQIAYDHAWRSPGNFAWIMLFFCLMHITIVYIIATLIKGIFWEVFFAVNTAFAQRQKETIQEQIKQKQINLKTAEILQINQAIQNNQYIEPNTIIRRQLIQNKFDQQIFFKLKKVFENDKNKLKTDKTKQIKAQKLIEDWDILFDDLLSQKSRLRYRKQSMQSIRSDSSHKTRLSIQLIQQLDEQDLQSELQDLLDKLLVDPRLKYHQIVAHPKIFVQFLKSKFKSPEQLINQYEFDLHLHPLHNQQSMYYHIYEINALLNIETSKRQQKGMIIKNLVEQNIIDEETGEKLLKKKLNQKIFNVDISGTLRKMFLADTNEALIKKFQTEYFSDLYGYSFKQINKMTLQPLLKLQATLTYSLRNIMRYPQINNTQFFEMITNIEDQVSNQLLKRGSLFKFVYKLKYQGDIWFSIEYKRQQEMRVHFIKSGLWCYQKQMQEKQVRYARDIFNWNTSGLIDYTTCEKYLKRFYQAFQGLAFSLLNQQQFFQSNPKHHVYDLYIQPFQVDKTARIKAKKLQISKIMVVILSKQEQREDIGLQPLSYNLSQISYNHNRHKKSVDAFQLDQSDDTTFQKLKNISTVDSQRIVANEGLPFSYIINLMKEISDIITIYAQNFVYQIEKVLNQQYQQKKNIENMVLYGSDFKGSKVNGLEASDSLRA